MSRETNDAFEAFAERKGYRPGTWNYIRTAEAWQEAIAFAVTHPQEAPTALSAAGVTLPDGAKNG